ncbi:hypothetical protein HW132_07005 [Brasilonema sp. CT11]|nr:hypothetical protein [Brasilonema sp. CT11]
MGLLDESKPWKEIVWKNNFGQVVNTPCTCPNRIPGLDAEGCLDCRIWWVDKEEVEKYFKRKRRQRASEDDEI